MDTDIMREICIKQGYVPVNCKMDGHMILALTNSQNDPCIGCNEDRIICDGRSKEAG